MTEADEARRARESRFGAYIMLTLGGLITLLCGTCTLWLGAASIAELFNAAEPQAREWGWPILIIDLIFGGVPTAVGVFLLVLGVRALRRGRLPHATVDKAFD